MNTINICDICGLPGTADEPLVFLAGFSDIREHGGSVCGDQTLCQVCHYNETMDYYDWSDDYDERHLEQEVG